MDVGAVGVLYEQRLGNHGMGVRVEYLIPIQRRAIIHSHWRNMSAARYRRDLYQYSKYLGNTEVSMSSWQSAERNLISS